ncbi:DUF1749-domain-containing protein [Atractiella rhizophila]|nr:DUF1749-domain-containing protein [Atractiella rhizophila]
MLTSAPTPVAGELHTYTPPDVLIPLPLFLSGSLESKKVLVFIPGLFDGLSTVPWTAPLSERLKNEGWALAQPHLSSAYKGFARGSLDRDVDEIEWAVEYLKRIGKDEIVLMGHSTGSQDTIHYLLNKSTDSIKKAILHAPVSDREGFPVSPSLASELAALYAECKAKGTEHKTIAPQEACDVLFGVGVSVYRAYSLFCVGGDDDYFSVSLPDTGDDHRAISQTFGQLPPHIPVLALFSGEDEYTPNIKTVQPQLIERWTRAAAKGVLTTYVLEGADHRVHIESAAVKLIDKVVEFLQLGEREGLQARI